jgi:hypothetical protein
MDPLQALRNEFGRTIQELRAEIATLRAKPTPSHTRRPKPSLPDPEKFTGQSLKYETWDAAIKAKLRIDGQAIGDATAQFYYVYLNLDNKTQALVLPQLAIAEESGSYDYNTILEQLSRVFNNPNKVQEAEDRLLVLKQDTSEPLAAYIAKFERILYEAKGQDWPDVTKISTFRKGLNTTLRNRLTQQLNLPRTYPEFLRVVQQLSGYSFSTQNQQPYTKPQAQSSHDNGDRMDLTAINTLEAMEYDAAEMDAEIAKLSF